MIGSHTLKPAWLKAWKTYRAAASGSVIKSAGRRTCRSTCAFRAACQILESLIALDGLSQRYQKSRGLCFLRPYCRHSQSKFLFDFIHITFHVLPSKLRKCRLIRSSNIVRHNFDCPLVQVSPFCVIQWLDNNVCWCVDGGSWSHVWVSFSRIKTKLNSSDRSRLSGVDVVAPGIITRLAACVLDQTGNFQEIISSCRIFASPFLYDDNILWFWSKGVCNPVQLLETVLETASKLGRGGDQVKRTSSPSISCAKVNSNDQLVCSRCVISPLTLGMIGWENRKFGIGVRNLDRLLNVAIHQSAGCVSRKIAGSKRACDSLDTLCLQAITMMYYGVAARLLLHAYNYICLRADRCLRFLSLHYFLSFCNCCYRWAYSHWSMAATVSKKCRSHLLCCRLYLVMIWEWLTIMSYPRKVWMNEAKQK